MHNIYADEKAEQTSDNYLGHYYKIKLTYCQTLPTKYFVRRGSTQTRQSMLQLNVAKKGARRTITGNLLSQLQP